MTKKKETDYFGFSNDYQYDRNQDDKVKKYKRNSLFFIAIKTFGTLAVIFIIIALSLSGYIAWNSVINDPIWIKFVKTFLAVMFAPIYLFYIFMRSIIFGLPN